MTDLIYLLNIDITLLISLITHRLDRLPPATSPENNVRYRQQRQTSVLGGGQHNRVCGTTEMLTLGEV